MASQDFDQLHSQIDTTVHTNGPTGKTTAPGLNALLHRLVTDLPAGSSLPADQLAALAAAIQPNAANPYATLADLAGLPTGGNAVVVEQDLTSNSRETVPSVAAVTTALKTANTAAYQRIADAITSTSQRTYYSSAQDALNGAGPGGTANLYSLSYVDPNPSDPTGTTKALVVPGPQMSVNMYGLNLLTPDANTDFIGFPTAGTYLFNGYNSTITQAVDTTSNGLGWTLTAYDYNHAYDITVRDVNIVLPGVAMSAIWFRSPGVFRYSGNIDSPYVTSATNISDTKELVRCYVGSVIGKGTINAHGGVNLSRYGAPTTFYIFNIIGNGTVDWTGDINAYDTTTIGLSVTATLILRNGMLDGTARKPSGLGLFNTPRQGTVILDNYSVLVDPSKTAISADKVILRGNTVVVGAIDANTIQDERPLANAGIAVTVEQNLSSNSTTSVPSVAAVAGLQTQISTEKSRMDTILVGAPAIYDTFKELADQLAGDERGTSAILATQQQHTQQLSILRNTTVEQDLTSNSATSVPSIVAVANAVSVTNGLYLGYNYNGIIGYNDFSAALANNTTLAVNTVVPTNVSGLTFTTKFMRGSVRTSFQLNDNTAVNISRGTYENIDFTNTRGGFTFGCQLNLTNGITFRNCTLLADVVLSDYSPIILIDTVVVGNVTGSGELYLYGTSFLQRSAPKTIQVTRYNALLPIEQNLSSNSTTSVPSVAAVSMAVQQLQASSGPGGRYRGGMFTANTDYAVNDWILVNNVYYAANTSFKSGSSFAAGNWSTIGVALTPMQGQAISVSASASGSNRFITQSDMVWSAINGGVVVGTYTSSIGCGTGSAYNQIGAGCYLVVLGNNNTYNKIAGGNTTIRSGNGVTECETVGLCRNIQFGDNCKRVKVIDTQGVDTNTLFQIPAGTTDVTYLNGIVVTASASGSSVTVEQNLSSNSTTSVPSVAAVEAAVAAVTYQAQSDSTAKYSDVILTQVGTFVATKLLNAGSFNAQLLHADSTAAFGPVRTTAADLNADIQAAFTGGADAAILRLEVVRTDTSRVGYLLFTI